MNTQDGLNSKSIDREELFVIDTADGYKIYTYLTHASVQFDHLNHGSKDFSTKPLFVMCHGLLGSPFQHIFFNGKRFFAEKGVDVLNFAFYSGRPGARKLHECSLQTHVRDFQTVISHYKKFYKKIFLAGHSLGAAVINEAQHSFAEKIVFWDPALWDSDEKKIETRSYNINQKPDPRKTITWDHEFFISHAMYQELLNRDETVLNQIKRPVKFIFAGQSGFIIHHKPAIERQNRKKNKTIQEDGTELVHEIAVINHASHSFDEPGAEQKLFEETARWFHL